MSNYSQDDSDDRACREYCQNWDWEQHCKLYPEYEGPAYDSDMEKLCDLYPRHGDDDNYMFVLKADDYGTYRIIKVRLDDDGIYRVIKVHELDDVETRYCGGKKVMRLESVKNLEFVPREKI